MILRLSPNGKNLIYNSKLFRTVEKGQNSLSDDKNTNDGKKKMLKTF